MSLLNASDFDREHLKSLIESDDSRQVRLREPGHCFRTWTYGTDCADKGRDTMRVRLVTETNGDTGEASPLFTFRISTSELSPVDPIGFGLVYSRNVGDGEISPTRWGDVFASGILHSITEAWSTSSGPLTSPIDEISGSLRRPCYCVSKSSAASHTASVARSLQDYRDDRGREVQGFAANHHSPVHTMDKLEEIPDITRVRTRPIQDRLVVGLTSIS